MILETLRATSALNGAMYAFDQPETAGRYHGLNIPQQRHIRDRLVGEGRDLWTDIIEAGSFGCDAQHQAESWAMFLDRRNFLLEQGVEPRTLLAACLIYQVDPPREIRDAIPIAEEMLLRAKAAGVALW